MTVRIEYHFDVACPWTWITSRWLTEVAPARDLDVTWRTFSLEHQNEGREVPEKFAAGHRAGRRVLRMIEAARAAHGNEAVGPIYTAAGTAFHEEQRKDVSPAEVLQRAGAPPDLAAAADGDEWDRVVVASTEEGMARAGGELGIPILTLVDPPRRATGSWSPVTMHGPVQSPAPTGSDALALWDAIAALAPLPVFELRRDRGGAGPVFASDGRR